MKPIQVYYLDDEPALCELFEEYFNTPEITVRTFTHAAEAIDAVSASMPGIMFIDYRLSDAIGDEVAARLPDDLPKVLITGDLSVDPRYRFDHIISKPFRFDEVEEIIRRIST